MKQEMKAYKRIKNNRIICANGQICPIISETDDMIKVKMQECTIPLSGPHAGHWTAVIPHKFNDVEIPKRFIEG